MSGIDGQDRGGTMALVALVVMVIGAGVVVRCSNPAGTGVEAPAGTHP